MELKAAIFDMDGVLFDTEKLYQQTWREMAQDMGVQLEDGFTQAISGTSGEKMKRVLEQYYHVPDGKVVADDCMNRMRKKLEIHVPVKDGVVEILTEFRKRGMKIAIASSSGRKQIESNLNNSYLAQYFDQIVCGEDVEHGKPAPDIFLIAAKSLGCNPEECYVFEDSENGVKAGYNAGCYVVMVPDLIQPSPDTVKCCSEIRSSLLEVLERWYNNNGN